MQLSTLILTLMASLAIAAPTNTGGGDDDCGCDDGGGGGGGGGGGDGGGGGGGDGGGGGGGTTPYDACSGLLYSQAQCCTADVAGVLLTTCASVTEVPTSPETFRDTCATTGKTAYCCTLSAAGLSLICQTPIGL